MPTPKLARYAALLALTFLAFATGAAGAQAPAGTPIQNAASLSYRDQSGQQYSAQSNTVATVYARVGALVVSPKKQNADPAADAIAAGTNVTRTFTIANVSNIDDAYTIQAANAAPGRIVSIAFVTANGTVPVTLGATASPLVPAGGSIQVQVIASSTGLALGTAFPITISAQTTAAGTTNGLQSDDGKQWAVVAPGPQLTGAGGPNTQVTKTVNHSSSVQSNPQSTVMFDIQARNSGGAPASNLVVTDVVPTGLQADLASVAIDGVAAGAAASLAGQTLAIKIPALPAGALLDVTFNATVTGTSIAGATFTNVATIAADGIAPVATTPASVLVGTTNIVFDPTNGNHPIGGAIATLLDASGTPVKLTQSSANGGALGANAQNPFITGSDGAFAFNLQPSQIAPGGSLFYLTISAPGYLNRKIALRITLGTGGLLYDVTSSSMDNQPLAVAGGYALTSQNVNLHDVFGLFGNVPLFTAQTIAISKTVDKPVAQSGDRLVYTIEAGNPSQSSLGPTIIVDTLPAGEAYAPGTARMDGSPLEPAIDGRKLTWSIGGLAAGATHALVYATVVFPSVAAGTTLVNNATASAQVPGTRVSASANATADVRVVAGPFSERGIITGRVFVDGKRLGRFTRGDEGIAGARVFLEDGSSVVTDADGRYSFDGVRPGAHVLRLDTSTLPSTVRPFANARMSSEWSMQRLVHGLFDDGLMQDVNFGVGGSP
ncbi:MAG: isopeptide-forming domain-containing fimbrial protein [Candidatus Eremiobacteraeota bacterium]|nr:isopeptide-forming domain-containing fimbrial protein [Candidatus Eremiobacteraeota bacterium]